MAEFQTSALMKALKDKNEAAAAENKGKEQQPGPAESKNAAQKQAEEATTNTSTTDTQTKASLESMRAAIDTLWMSLVSPETAPDRKGLSASSLLHRANAAADRLKKEAQPHAHGADASVSKPSGRSTLLSRKTIAKHSSALSELAVDFAEDFAQRREMVLCRLEATRHCFAQTQKAQKKSDQLQSMCAQKVLELSSAPKFTAEDMVDIAAEDAAALLLSSSTESANLMRRFKMAGKVPDRGGRCVCVCARCGCASVC
jgi:hypothetical protein